MERMDVKILGGGGNWIGLGGKIDPEAAVALHVDEAGHHVAVELDPGPRAGSVVGGVRHSDVLDPVVLDHHRPTP